MAEVNDVHRMVRNWFRPIVLSKISIDCNSQVFARGLCWAHGGGKICTIQGCQTRARTKGKCDQHGGRNFCTVPDCGRVAQFRGHCYRHGGYRLCNVDGCTQRTFSNKARCPDHLPRASSKSISYQQTFQHTMESILNPMTPVTSQRIIIRAKFPTKSKP